MTSSLNLFNNPNNNKQNENPYIYQNQINNKSAAIGTQSFSIPSD